VYGRTYIAHRLCALCRRHSHASKIALAIIGCALGCFAFTSAQILPGAQSLPDHIQGVVVNRVTREPIARALVFSPDRRFATLTDAQGRFQFQLSPQTGSYAVATPMPDMPYALSARRPGFLQTQDATVNLTPSAIASDITIPLTPEAHIVGRVTLASGEPSEPIQVRLFRRTVRDGIAHWDETGSAETRSNGGFRFAELSAGDYKVVTSELLDRDPADSAPGGTVYGYPPAYYPNATDFSSAKIISLGPGVTAPADMAISKRAYYPVKIVVPNAPAITGLTLVVSVQGHHGPGYALSYNSQARTIEGLLPDGSYLVEAYNYGQSSSNGSLLINIRGAPLTNATMALVPNSSIAVEVTNEFAADSSATGGPVAPRVRIGSGAMAVAGNSTYVYLQAADEFDQLRTAVSQPSSTGEANSLTIDGVAPGHYWVKVYSPRGYAASITSGAVDLQHQPLVVGTPGTTSPIEITMRDTAAELDGTVDSQGAGAVFSAAHVYLVPLPDSSGEFHDVFVAADGSFQAPAVPPGEYRVMALASPEQLPYRDPEAMHAYDSSGVVVDLQPGEKQKIQLHLMGGQQ
jgi:hypothetical protein